MLSALIILDICQNQLCHQEIERLQNMVPSTEVEILFL